MTTAADVADLSMDVVTQGSLRTGSGRALPLARTEVSAQVAGHVAAVVVRQRFHNDTAQPIEAIYAFPLPDGASVYRMEFRIEDRVVRAVVKEKAQARRDYEEARAAGRAATLLEEDKPALFTLSVANVAPGATIDVELEYQELCAFDDGRFRLVFPMVAPERYREGPAPSASEKLPPPRVPTGERELDVAIAIDVRGVDAAGVRSTSHPVEIAPIDRGGARIKLAPKGALANRDFVLEWQAGGAGVRPEILFERRAGEPGAFLFTVLPPSSEAEIERQGGGMKALSCGNCGGLVTDLSAIREVPLLGPVVPCRYCGALLAPGTERVTRATRPRDVVILVDRSASMRGSTEQARAAVRAILDALGPSDGAQIIAFDHERIALDGDGSRFLPVSPELRDAADRFIVGLPPRGGTELEEALVRVKSLPAREGRTRVVVLIGDAAVGNEGRLIRRLPEILGAGTRLFALGVGRRVDRRLVSRFARAAGGSSDVLPAWGDSSEAIRRFARRVASAGPVLTDLVLWWDDARIADVYPKPIPDLYSGQPVHLLGRFDGIGPSRAILSGRTASGTAFRQEIEIEAPAASDQAPGLLRLWARRHVEALAERIAADPVLEPALAREALTLSLAHSIVGPYTSLVAVDSEIAVKKLLLPVGTLSIVRGADVGKAFRLDRERFVVGRAVGADIRLNDAQISRHHFEVLADEAGFMLRDLSSVNGVFIKGQSTREARLADGMTLQVGQTLLCFTLDPSATFEYLPTRRVEAALGDEDDLETTTAGDVPMLDDRTRAALVVDDAEIPRERRSRPSAPVLRAPLGVAPAIPGPPPIPGAAPPPAAPSFGPPASSSAMMGFGPPSGFAPAVPETPPPPAFCAPPEALTASPPPVEGYAAREGGRALHETRFSRSLSDAPPQAKRPSAPPPAAMPAEPPPMARRARGFTDVGPPAPAAPAMAPPAPVPPASPSPMRAPPRARTITEAMPPPPPGMGAPLHQTNAPPVPQSPIEAPGSEPYPEHELRWLADRIRGELDLVFLVDATGSMGAYIQEVKQRLLELVDALRASPLCRSLRIGLVSYRDHPPQDRSYASRVSPLTADIESIRSAVLDLSAAGGGDGPESVTDGLFDVVRLEWRPSAVRAVVWFGDAPPHGVEPEGDAFPAGCPCGHHWYAQAESCREMGITIYGIGCLPGLRNFVGAEGVFRTVARATRGMFLPLREAGLLVPLIAGAAASELDKQRLDEHVAEVWRSNTDVLAATDEAERARWIASALRARGVQIREMRLASESSSAAPLRFRDVTEADVIGALDRLRLAGRVAA